MDPKDPSHSRSRSDGLSHHALEAFGPEDGLRQIVRLCASFCDAPVLLLIWNAGGIWFHEGHGFSQDQWIALESVLGSNIPVSGPTVSFGSNGDGPVESIPLHGSHDRIIGSLNVLTRLSDPLSTIQTRALRLAVSQIQALIDFKQQGIERRTSSRGLTASSFVPGLVHELRNFIFGISASLDAFTANAIGKRDFSKYEEHIRKALDRLNAFIDELRLFGDPTLASKEECWIEPLLREAVEHHRHRSIQREVELDLQIEKPLPALHADKNSLALAFIHLIDLSLEQEPGGKVVFRVESCRVDEVETICGCLDSTTLNLKGLDPIRLFEPFYVRVTGSGRLTLPNARRIMEHHGGSLTAIALPEGGTRIRFMLPSVAQYPRPSVDRS